MKAYLIFLILIIIICSCETLNAQETIGDARCRVYYTENALGFEKWLNGRSEVKTRKADQVYRVPVVVHVLHNGEPIGEGLNLSTERIESQVRVLNEDFRRKEGTRGYNEHPDGEDARVEFVLARSSPTGEATNGIVRVDMTAKEPPPFQGNPIMAGAYHSFWDPNRYLNIWAFPGFKDTALGEARFPVSTLPGLEDQQDQDWKLPGIGEVDGLVINSLHFGTSNIDSKYNLGRTGTHEVGHFLGLFHVWGKNVNGGPSCDQDDFCQDTPPTGFRVSHCPQDLKACDGSRAMVENYMDYADDACMHIFTKDQVARMHAVLENSPRRKSLLTSPGLNPPITGTPGDMGTFIKIYPNPASGRLFIRFETAPSYPEIRLTLYDGIGRVKMSQQHIVGAAMEWSIELPYGDKGVLLLRLETGDHVLYRRITAL